MNSKAMNDKNHKNLALVQWMIYGCLPVMKAPALNNC